jgi:hypothetical protein
MNLPSLLWARDDEPGVHQYSQVFGHRLPADPEVGGHRAGVVRPIGQPDEDAAAGPVGESGEDAVSLGREQARPPLPFGRSGVGGGVAHA